MRLLDRLYAAGAVLAAVFLLLIATLTLAQVIGRMVGVLIPDAGDFAGYAMAASIFLALAHTFRSGGHIRVNLLLIHVPRRLRRALECWCLVLLAVLGGHIRVNLLLIHVPRRLRRALECWCLVLLALLGGLFAAFAVKMVVDSFTFGDVSTGMMPIPLWIPQSSMALGALLLELAVIEETVRVFRGAEPRYERAEAEAFTE